MRLFHADNSQIRCLIGSLGSGKTTAAAMEVCYYKPRYMRKTFGIVETRWCIIRNTYRELLDTTFDELKKWFPNGDWVASTMTYTLRFPRTKGCGDFVVILLLRSCDKPEHMKKFKSMNLTGYWMDESIEINEDIKKMVRGRLGRFPRNCPVRYGVETSNPCDIEHPTYWMFKWARNFEPPGPLPSKPAVGGFVGWWQKPRENVANLRPGYYEDLAREYAVTPEWVEMFVEGKPGMPLKGRLVYANFKRDIHVAFDPLVWMHSPDEFGRERGVSLYVGWDNTGNFPAAVVVQIVGPLRAQVLREYWSEREGIVDFAKRVKQEMEREFPGYTAKHYCFAAGTLVATTEGWIPIEKVKVGMYALTRDGPHMIINTMKRGPKEVRLHKIGNRYVYCTPDHPVHIGGEGFKNAGLLTPLDTPCIISDREVIQCRNIIRWKSRLKGIDTDETLEASREPIRFITGVLGSMVREASIGQCGLPFTVRFLTAMTFITLTGILSTTPWKILKLWRRQDIGLSVLNGSRKWLQKSLKRICERPGKRQKRGIEAQKVLHGTGHILQKSVTRLTESVRNAVNTIWAQRSLNFALAGASSESKESSASTEKCERVLSVIGSSGATSIVTKDVARILAELPSNGSSVSVYNITVADKHEYYANGILVSNCDPAAFSQFSRSGVQGGLTSNAELMREETGISCIPSEQNPIARQSAVDQMLARRDGVLIDRSCTRLITGFTSSYVFQEVYGAMAGEFKRQPWKNKFSHCQDALQYVFVKLFPPILRNKIGSDPYAGYKKDYMIPSDYESEEAEIDWDAKRF